MTKSRHQMPKTLEEVDPFVRSLKAVVCAVLSPETTFRFEVCISEALTNIVKHAKPKKDCRPINITVIDQPETLAVEIFDPVGSDEFDPRDHAYDLENIDPLAEEGRGINLIMQCADAVDYGLSGERNRLALYFAKPIEPIITMQSGEQK